MVFGKWSSVFVSTLYLLVDYIIQVHDTVQGGSSSLHRFMVNKIIEVKSGEKPNLV